MSKIEDVAEALYDLDCQHSMTCDMPADWEFFAQDNPKRAAQYRLKAQAALSAIVPEGNVVVPRDLTGLSLISAMNETKHQRDQVQGFLYNTPEGALTDKPKHHVVRDLTKRPGSQTVWSAFGGDDDYVRLIHERDRQIEWYQAELIVAAMIKASEGAGWTKEQQALRRTRIPEAAANDKDA